MTLERRTPLRAKPRSKDNGLCECGCGEPTAISRQTDTKRGYVKGEPMRFRAGHGGHEKLRMHPDELYDIQSKGYTTPCWIWRGGQSGNGYGRLSHDGRVHGAHRWFYEREHGPVPEGKFLDHLCRVTLCCNPAHLEPVTHTENVRRGIGTKLTALQVAEIRNVRDQLLRAAGPTSDGKPRRRVPNGRAIRAALGDEYGVTPDQIKHIWGGRSWR
jgi:hypothetical protein